MQFAFKTAIIIVVSNDPMKVIMKAIIIINDVYMDWHGSGPSCSKLD